MQGGNGKLDLPPASEANAVVDAYGEVVHLPCDLDKVAASENLELCSVSKNVGNDTSVDAGGSTVSINVEVPAVSGEVKVATAYTHAENLEGTGLIVSGNVGGVDNSTLNLAAEVYVPSDEVPEGKGSVAEVSNVGLSNPSEAVRMVLTPTLRYKRRASKTVTPFLPRKLADRCPGEASGAGTEGLQNGTANVDEGDNDLNDEVNLQNTDEVVLAGVLAAMSYATDENQLYNVTHLEDIPMQECRNNDDKDVSEKEDGGAGSDFENEDENWINDDLKVEKVVTRDLRGSEESKGKTVPVLKSKKRRKGKTVPALKSTRKRQTVSALKNVDTMAVDACSGKAASGSKMHKGKKAFGKRVADKLKAVKKRLKKKAKIDSVDTIFKDSAKKFHTTCQLDKFVEVTEQLTAAQIRAVKEIGFGGLLKFKIRSVPKDLVQNLIQHFDSTAVFQSIGSERYAVDKNDVYDMFQLPISDKPVVEVNHKVGPKDGIFVDDLIRATWFEKYASKDGVITVKDLYTRIPGLVDDDQMEEFKRVFVMFAVSCFLAPAARSNVDMKIVASLQNVDMISSYDWCGFVLKRFCATVSRVENSEKIYSLNVCLIIPLLAFFYRYPIPGVVDPIELPLHKHWDTEKVKKRRDVLRRGGYTSFKRATQHFPLTDDGILIGQEYRNSDGVDDAGFDFDGEDLIMDNASSDSDDEDLRRLKESKGKMVPALKSRKRRKVSASKKYDPMAVDASLGKVTPKSDNVEKSVVASSSKTREGRKASGKRVADKLELVKKKSKKAKIDSDSSVSKKHDGRKASGKRVAYERKERANNDDKYVSEMEDGEDDAGSDSDDEDWTQDNAISGSDDEDWIDDDLRGLKESKGKMVPGLKSKKKQKVSSDPMAVDACFRKIVQKFVNAGHSVVVSSSKKLENWKPSEKRVDKFEVVEKKLKKKAEIDTVDTIPDNNSAKKFLSTCQLDKFVEVIEQLTAAQVRAVEEIGFGGLLKFNIRSVPKDLVQNLVQHFNSTALVQDIGSERYALNKNDVYDMFQIPISDQPVVEISHNGPKDVVPSDNWIRDIWFKKYASKDGVITVKDLCTQIPCLVNDDQMKEFKRVFVMFSISCFLAPAARNNVDMKIVASLQNVDMISSYDWCGFVLKRFCATLSRVEKSEKINSLNVCLIIPLLAFFYRYPIPGVVDPIELPLHKHWDTEKVKKRGDVLRRGGYTSFLRGTRQFPLTDNGILIGCPTSSTSTKHGCIQLELPDDTLNDEEIERLAKSPLEVAKMKFKRLVSIASDEYIQALARIDEALPTHPIIAQMDAMFNEVMEEKAKRVQVCKTDTRK